ncbi:MAG: hypothetical protein M3Y08_07430 [Fibrobacterota bacterium]|nr:hypothetical protein [Fibrobacterota bacterium]
MATAEIVKSRKLGTKFALVCVLSIGGCLSPADNCDPRPCAKYRYEVEFTDSQGRKIDTVGTAGLRINFNPIIPAAETAAGGEGDCAGCTNFIPEDSAILTADRSIVSPEGDIVPSGSNLLDPPWNGMLGTGDLHFQFHKGVRFESGRYAFSMKALWTFEKTRTILIDTSYLHVP